MASCIAETPPGGRDGLTTPMPEHMNDDDLDYATVNGVTSAHPVAVTSTLTSLNSGTSTPSRHRAIHIPSGSLDPASRAARNFNLDSNTSAEVLVAKLAHELETNYQIQANLRLQKYLTQYQTGVPEEEEELFKQREAVARTKFIVYKDAQVTKLTNELKGVNTTPATPTPPSHRREATDNPFKVTPQFPPPRFSSRDRNINNNGSGISFGSMSPSNSGAGNSSLSGMNGNNASSFPSATEATDVTTGFTRDQIVQAFSATWDYIASAQNETVQLKSEITELKQLLVALTGGSDRGGLSSRVANLEQKISAIQNGQPLESDNALVANLASDVAKLRVEVANTLSRRTFDSENELTKMTFNNKCALIEKYLGIDITTTGPKPHDVLEALHHRIWHLEEYLPINDPSCKIGKHYKPLNEYMKTVLGKGNSVVNYSATPGYGSSGVSDTSSIHGVPGSGGMHAYAFVNQGLGGLLSGNPLAYSQASNADFTQPGTSNQFLNNSNVSQNMRADLADLRFRAQNIGGHYATAQDNTVLPAINAQVPRSATLPSLVQQESLIPTDPRSFDFEKRVVPKPGVVQLKSPPRRARAATSQAGSPGLAYTPTKQRQTGGNSSTNSESTTKGTTDKNTAPKLTKDRAYQAWLNQRPGEFAGKKLTGLGQKE